MKHVQTFDEALADLVDDYKSIPYDEVIAALEMQILTLQEEKSNDEGER